MTKFLVFLKSNRYYVIGFTLILFFFLLRSILLTKPNTDITYTVKREDLVDTVQVSGTYTTASQTPVNSPTNGIVDQLYVANNDQVKKGDPLFHTESTATVDQQKAAYANYQIALNTLQTAQQNKTGFQSQLEQDRQAVITASSNVDIATNRASAVQPNPATGSNYSQNDLNAIKSSLVSARETFSKDEQKYLQADTPIAAAQAQVSNTRELYDETQSITVTSPINGTVVNLLTKNGEQVSAPQLASPNQPVLMIANLGHPYITIDISEDYATRVSSGQKVSIVFDALKEQTFSGIVDTIATVGTNTQGIVTYTARVISDNISSNIKPNMTALITIETLRKDNVIDVPNSAILTKGKNSYVEQSNNHNLIPVTLGTKGITKIEITGGLLAGTNIVVNPKQN